MPTRVAVSSEVRANACQLLRDYAAEALVKLQVYAGRPRSLHPPTAFVDEMRESVTFAAGFGGDRQPSVDLLLVWGTFDSADTTAQADEFVDGFYAWVADRPHALHPNSIVESIQRSDEPTFTPDWVPPDEQKAYYATRLTLSCLFPNT